MSRAMLSSPKLATSVRAAIDSARGDRRAAALALGVDRPGLYRRLALRIGTRVRGGLRETGLEWIERRWPQRPGHQATQVVEVRHEGKGLERIRVYVLAAHGEVAAGEHVNRVLPVGVVRQRVVCQQCKEARAAEAANEERS